MLLDFGSTLPLAGCGSGLGIFIVSRPADGDEQAVAVSFR